MTHNIDNPCKLKHLQVGREPLTLGVVPFVEWRVAHVVHALRKEFGWDVQELATKARMNPSLIYRLEDGRTKNPTDDTLKKIGAVFGMSALDIRNAVPTDPIKVPSIPTGITTEKDFRRTIPASSSLDPAADIVIRASKKRTPRPKQAR